MDCRHVTSKNRMMASRSISALVASSVILIMNFHETSSWEAQRHWSNENKGAQARETFLKNTWSHACSNDYCMKKGVVKKKKRTPPPPPTQSLEKENSKPTSSSRNQPLFANHITSFFPSPARPSPAQPSPAQFSSAHRII